MTQLLMPQGLTLTELFWALPSLSCHELSFIGIQKRKLYEKGAKKGR